MSEVREPSFRKRSLREMIRRSSRPFIRFRTVRWVRQVSSESRLWDGQQAMFSSA